MLHKKPNRLKEYYCYIRDTDTLQHQQYCLAIVEDLGVSIHRFRRKISAPQSFSPAEKRALALIYKLPVHFIFPELETA